MHDLLALIKLGEESHLFEKLNHSFSRDLDADGSVDVIHGGLHLVVGEVGVQLRGLFISTNHLNILRTESQAK